MGARQLETRCTAVTRMAVALRGFLTDSLTRAANMSVLFRRSSTSAPAHCRRGAAHWPLVRHRTLTWPCAVGPSNKGAQHQLGARVRRLVAMIPLLVTGPSTQIDLAAYFPNYDYALTHDLIGVDSVSGRAVRLHYQFIPPFRPGDLPTTWSRSFDWDNHPCWQDWQTWSGAGFYWQGYLTDCEGSNVWSTALHPWPRFITVPGTLLNQRLALIQTIRPSGDAALMGPNSWLVTVDDTPGGFTIKCLNQDTGAFEQWWFGTLPVDTGGTAPGFARVQAFDGTAVTFDATYTEWVRQ